ncbi:MAG: AAA family ATPase [Spirochaetaceae bacterium]|nr:AAA family ATPase [Spirochaetaceae bacterium]
MKSLDLFAQREINNEPLAYRMRPRNLNEYIGQEHIIGKGRLLRRAIQADQLSSLIFYGPPGTGKTTLAKVIANTTKSHFSTINAVLSGVKELREEIDAAKNRLDLYDRRTILFIDEVHRWNKSQQDALLPWVENGTFILIGATTENPYFEVNKALVSRSRIFQLKSLTDEDLIRVANQAIADKERGYGEFKISFEKGALEHIVNIAKGDARSLLNALQLAIETSVDKFPPVKGTSLFISKKVAEESIQQKAVLYDKEGDYHFDVISAFIKSIRGSDPDATLYWLAKMIAAGEDPRFIFRRMLISAAEDVGLAEPNAVAIVEADAAAFDRIGLPEGRFHLSHAALYISTCEKSNTTLALFDALRAIEKEKQDDEVPNHLRDASRDKDSFGHGEGYLYPHAYREHFVAQQYLPDSLQGKVFYNPGKLGYESKVRNSVLSKRESQLEASNEDTFVENLTYSPNDKARDQWINRTTSERGILVEKIRDEIFNPINFLRSDRVLILGAGHGLLLWEAFRKTPEGLVCAQVNKQIEFDYITNYSNTLDLVTKPFVALASPLQFIDGLEKDLNFEKIIIRNQFSNYNESEKILNKCLKHFGPNTDLIIAQTIPSGGSRLSDFAQDLDIKGALLSAEEEIFKHDLKGITGWNESDLEALIKENKLFVQSTILKQKEQRYIVEKDIERWIEKTYYPTLQKLNLNEDKTKIINYLISHLSNKSVSWNHKVLIMHSSKLVKQGKKESNIESNKIWKDVHIKTKSK